MNDDQTKNLAIHLAGIKSQFPYSPHEPSSEQKFDMMWPSRQKQYLKLAAYLQREATP